MPANESERYVFLDPRRVRNASGVVRRFHPAKKHDGPVLVKEREWEKGGIEVGQSVLYHDGRFRMWYMTMMMVPGERPANPDVVAYAESTDGIHWERPDVGLLEFDGSRKNSLVNLFGLWPSVMPGLPGTEFEGKLLALSMPTGGPHPENRASVKLGLPQQVAHEPRYDKVLPTGLETDAGARRWGYDPHGGFLAWVSDDGLDWRLLDEKCVMRELPDNGTFVTDEARGRYFGAPKLEPLVGDRERRSVAVSSSEDFLHWETPRLVMTPDQLDDHVAQLRGYRSAELYGIGLYPCGDFIIGMLWIFYVSDQEQLVGSNFAMYGQIEPQLCYSFDGVTRHNWVPVWQWERDPHRRAFIPLGERGEFDGGIIMPTSVVEVGDELYIYYSAGYGEHSNAKTVGAHPDWHGSKLVMDERTGVARQGGFPADYSLGLATMKRDRFCSVSADREGFVELSPQRITGGRLTVNARTAMGYVAAELRDVESGEPLAGFARDDCRLFEGDALRGELVWKEKRLSDAPADREVVLRFYLKDADLFAYELG